MAKQTMPEFWLMISWHFAYIAARLAWSSSTRASTSSLSKSALTKRVSFQVFFRPPPKVLVSWLSMVGRLPQYTAQKGTLSQTLSQ